jgi:hypothetical protein
MCLSDIGQKEPFTNTGFRAFLDDARLSLGADLLRSNHRTGLTEGVRLNEAVQCIIQRLLLLRVYEDRGLSTDGIVQDILDRQNPQQHRSTGSPDARASGGFYRQICKQISTLSQRASPYRRIFESPLFQLPDSEAHVVSDAWLVTFLAQLEGLTAARSSSAARENLLGSLHEQSLHAVLRVSNDGAVTLDKKSAARKAGGVYYTPDYIVSYIVEQTVGRVLNGKTPGEVATLRFLDLACGSGAFLLPIFERVLEHYRRWFQTHSNGSACDNPDYFLDAAGYVRLTPSLRRRVLQENIFGVDLDARAIQVTRLSLYLKIHEDDNRDAGIARVDNPADENPALPSLDDNILCGNSLIASDFSHDPAELIRVGAFDWDRRFPAIMRAGGFDAVVGNPPYVSGEFLDGASKRYFKNHYDAASGQMDLYHLFFERSLRLTKLRGYHGYIVPDAILARDETAGLRRLLVEQHALTAVAHPGAVFPGAGVSTAILCTQALAADNRPISLHRVAAGQPPSLIREIEVSEIAADPAAKIMLETSAADHALLKKLRSQPHSLGTFCTFSRGEELGKKHVARPKHKVAEHEWIRVGEDVHRYHLQPASHQVRRSQIKKRPANYEGPKLLIVKTGERPQATLDPVGAVTLQSLYNVHARDASTDLRAILAIINSKAVSWYLRKTVTSAKKLFPQFNQTHFEQLPVPACPDDVNQRLAPLVEKMLTLTPALSRARGASTRAALQTALTATDRAIDRLIYTLYDFTAEEIALVEASENQARTSLENEVKPCSRARASWSPVTAALEQF